MREIINYRKFRKISIGLALVFILLFLSPELLMKLIEPELLNYRILPMIWGCFLFVFFRFIPRVHPAGRNSMLEIIYLEAIVCAAVLIGMRFMAGSIIGEMGESPYILTPSGIFDNLLYTLPPLIARETVRSYILNAFCNKSNVKIFVLVTAVITLSDVNFTELMTLTTLKDFTIYLAEDFGPILSQNIMLSYLALYGGPLTAIFYIGIITVFEFTSPILPVLNWLTAGAIGILVPIFTMMFIIKKYENRTNNIRRKDMSRWDAVQWTATSLLSIGLIWFVVGVFPIVPSVIATGSMEPLIDPGDIVLLRQVRTENQVLSLKKGDIIQFQRGGIRITHRIIDIEKDKSGRMIIHTKGDNNSIEDSQTVNPNDVKGIYYKVIPKLGYPTLLLKGQFGSEPKEEVRF